MKTIIIKSIVAGPGGTYQPQQLASVEDDFADALVGGGYAEPVGVTPEPVPTAAPESAAIAPAEDAALPPAKLNRFAKKK